MTNTTVIVDPKAGGLWPKDYYCASKRRWFMANTTVIVDPVNCLGVSKHISDTVYAPFIRYKCNYLVQHSDGQQYTSTVSTKYGVCVLGAAPLLTLNAATQHRALYFFIYLRSLSIVHSITHPAIRSININEIKMWKEAAVAYSEVILHLLECLKKTKPHP
jgi:hypothetical protein